MISDWRSLLDLNTPSKTISCEYSVKILSVKHDFLAITEKKSLTEILVLEECSFLIDIASLQLASIYIKQFFNLYKLIWLYDVNT